jgi:cytoskeleton protein RodZ
MKSRQKRPHSGAVVAAAPVPMPAPADNNNQIPSDLAHAAPPMTSPHDDSFHATATDSGPAASTDAAAEPFAAETAGRELFSLPPEAAPEPSLGERLRAARERRGWGLDDVCTRLRLPHRVVATLESNDFGRIEHDVYLRGYLASYARLLDIPQEAVAHQLSERKSAPPALVATGRISHSRYLFQRYSVPTVYVILTGLIVAPAVWLATHGGLDQNLARLAPLEQPALPEPAITAPVTMPLDTTAGSIEPRLAAAPVETAPAAEQPLMASLVPGMKHEPAPPVAAPAALPAGSHELRLRLKDASWVEVLGADGQKVEFGLLPAGTDKSYTVTQAVNVRLGNSANAELLLDGSPVDLAPFRRAAVAHLKLVNGAPTAAGSDN